MSNDGITYSYDLSEMDRIIHENDDTLDNALNALAHVVEAAAKLSFGTSPPGASYNRRSVSHVASRSGYPPNVDTGALRASISVDKIRQNEYRVGDGVKYGVWLELGNERLGGARPFMNPALIVAAEQMAKIIQGALSYGSDG